MKEQIRKYYTYRRPVRMEFLSSLDSTNIDKLRGAEPAEWETMVRYCESSLELAVEGILW
jgi:hypothetical protein